MDRLRDGLDHRRRGRDGDQHRVAEDFAASAAIDSGIVAEKKSV